jgi:hypothetical protein
VQPKLASRVRLLVTSQRLSAAFNVGQPVPTNIIQMAAPPWISPFDAQGKPGAAPWISGT